MADSGAPTPAASTRTALTLDELAERPADGIRGIGPAMVARLQRLGVHSQLDLLLHLPFRYEDRTHVVPIADLEELVPATVEGIVDGVRARPAPRRMLEVALRDESGDIVVRFFHYTRPQLNALQQGVRMRCYTTPRRNRRGALELIHPDYQSGVELPQLPDHLTPVYRTTEGIPPASLRRWISAVLDRLHPTGDLDELLTPLPTLGDALRTLHQPAATLDPTRLTGGFHPAHQRLAAEELTAHLLAQHRSDADRRSRTAPVIQCGETDHQAFLQALPFEPTPDQQQSIADIYGDIAEPMPMRRLVQGDVGSGKTLVAAAALHACAVRQHQAALMAPTSLLAQQHHASVSAWLEPLGIRCALLTGATTAAERRAIIERLHLRDIDVLTGTHAIYEADVQFQRLGLVVIDEQHRFGVHQRLSVQAERSAEALEPHQLVMTATPIPRTLAMSAYSTFDTSIIRSRPAGRQPITTAVVANRRRGDVMERMRAALQTGRQAYWVCTLVEENEDLDVESAEATAELLGNELPGVAVGLVHGKLNARDKLARLEAFRRGETRLLVATTVIEVGVDVPNASLMVIEDADRLGLAQLHQLRGRVGRGAEASSCVLLYPEKVSARGRARLDVMRSTNDGFEIAEKDLELRGPGDLLGTRQTGLAEFRVADLGRDHALLEVAEHCAGQIDQQQADALIRRWSPGDADYARV